MSRRIKKSSYVLVEYFGPLYVTDSFRNGPDATGYRWTEYCGINGDGCSYQFEAGEVVRELTRNEFDELLRTGTSRGQGRGVAVAQPQSSVVGLS